MAKKSKNTLEWQKKSIYLSVLLIFVILLTLGTKFFADKKINPGKSSAPTPYITPEITDQDLAEKGWTEYKPETDSSTALYTNKELGIEFKYPKKLYLFLHYQPRAKFWNIVPLIEDRYYLMNIGEPNYPFQLVVVGQPNSVKGILEAWTLIEDMKDKKVEKSKINPLFTKVSGIADSEYFGKKYHEFYYVLKGDRLYIFLPGFGSFDEATNQFRYTNDYPIEQIISSFKFLK